VIWFCDSSAVLKHYVREIGSQWFRRHVPSHRVILAKITPLEMKAGLALRFHTGRISQFDFFKARNTLTRHLLTQHYDVWQLTDRFLMWPVNWYTSTHSAPMTLCNWPRRWIMSKQPVLIASTFNSSPPTTNWNERRKPRVSTLRIRTATHER